ncbi:LysR family transcriptional regulator [Acidiphilium sp.]|uniref:LysR family transcriptional regulator n=1 Tax=Acidiphilium sp. TaxID=527 RepID=UPI003CFC8913
MARRIDNASSEGSVVPAAAGGAQPATPYSIRLPRLYAYFDAIIRYGSIRSAAEALRIASSALNRRVLDLERDVGATLFERQQKGVRLTPAGEIFAAHVRRMMSDAKQASDQLQDLRQPMGGTVAIGSAESAAIEIVPPLLARLQREHPTLRFIVAVGTPQDLLTDLIDDRVDLILTHERPGLRDAAVVAEAHKPFCALMRQDHPMAVRPQLLLRNCLSYPIVLAREDLAARALVDTALAAHELTTHPVLVTNMFEVMKHYVRLTDAISFQFHLTGPAAPPLDGVVAVPLADPQLVEARLLLVVRRARSLPASAALVCERLRLILSGQP